MNKTVTVAEWCESCWAGATQTPEVPSEHSLIFNEEPEALLATKTLEGPVRPPPGSASDALENEPPRLRCSLLRD